MKQPKKISPREWREMTAEQREIAAIESDYIIDIAMWRELYPRLTQKKVNEAAEFLEAHNEMWRANRNNIHLLMDTVQQLHPEVCRQQHRPKKSRERAKSSGIGAILFLAFIIWILFKLVAHGQTSGTAGGVAVLRRFGTNIYNVARWPNTAVPNLAYNIVGVYNGIPGSPMEISGHAIGDNSGIIWTVFKNFPYDPKDFYGGNVGRIPARPLFCKALFVGCHTNFTVSGSPIYITVNYDCGEPVNAK